MQNKYKLNGMKKLREGNTLTAYIEVDRSERRIRNRNWIKSWVEVAQIKKARRLYTEDYGTTL